MKRALNIPMVCTLQDEHTWLDAIPEPYGSQCWVTMSAQARDVDGFIAVSDWYAGEMSRRMNIPRHEITVAPVGMELNDIQPVSAPPDPPAIGYLSRLTESLGVGLLVDAFIQIKKRGRIDNLKLRLTGGHTAEDTPFIDHILAELRRHAIEKDVKIAGHFDKQSRHAFLRSLPVLSVPVPGGESIDTFIIEALAWLARRAAAAGASLSSSRKTGGASFTIRHRRRACNHSEELLLDPPAPASWRQGREGSLAQYSVNTMESVWLCTLA